MTETFKALVVSKDNDKVEHQIRQLSVDDLPEGDVLVAVKYSSLNYKDCLAVKGQGKIVRKYPIVPGVDLTGEVVSSVSPDFQPGDLVLLTGWGVGEQHWGGYTQLARLKSEWLIPLPKGLDALRSMAIGSAGLAALVEDEINLGATVIDMGAGTTSVAVFYDGHLIHADSVPIGGAHVTSDIARGLSTPLAHAERQ